MTTRVLLVDDDSHVADALTSALVNAGFEVQHAPDGRAALAAPTPDLVLLDLGLPDIDGVEVCRRPRAHSDVPIIVVSARGSSDERVGGLRAGADDYLVKPFALDELIARMEAVWRRVPPHGDDQRIEVGAVRIDVSAHVVTVGEDEVTLTRKEFDLIVFLARNAGRVVERSEILREVWHTTWEGRSRTVDTHVAVVRQKLGLPSLITTIRGVGYRFEGG